MLVCVFAVWQVKDYCQEFVWSIDVRPYVRRIDLLDQAQLCLKLLSASSLAILVHRLRQGIKHVFAGQPLIQLMPEELSQIGL